MEQRQRVGHGDHAHQQRQHTETGHQDTNQGEAPGERLLCVHRCSGPVGHLHTGSRHGAYLRHHGIHVSAVIGPHGDPVVVERLVQHQAGLLGGHHHQARTLRAPRRGRVRDPHHLVLAELGQPCDAHLVTDVDASHLSGVGIDHHLAIGARSHTGAEHEVRHLGVLGPVHEQWLFGESGRSDGNPRGVQHRGGALQAVRHGVDAVHTRGELRQGGGHQAAHLLERRLVGHLSFDHDLGLVRRYRSKLIQP